MTDAAPTPKPISPDTPTGHPISWALYLGCSWTWVIGMFFPALLLRDYGLAGYLTFALPNVIGAAAMGYVLTNAAAARRLATEHRAAVRAFSWWTIAFHLFALPWLIEGVLITGPGAGRGLGLAMLVPLVLGALAIVTGGRWRSVLALCAATAGVSWAIAIVYLTTLETSPAEIAPRLSSTDLLFFAAPNLLGFFLCPYLDATFLRARASTSPVGGRVAFTLGFGVVFASMIVFAAIYGRTILEGLWTDSIVYAGSTQLALVALFIAVQGSLTVALHARELRRPIEPNDAPQATPNSHPLAQPLVISLLAASAIAGIVFALTHGEATRIMPPAELVYRTFLTAYGVVIPAYVWVCIWPAMPNATRDNDPAALANFRKRRLIAFYVASALAYPVALIGFTTGPSWLLLVCAAIVTLGRLPAGLPRWIIK
ncbi:MAG: hypothetical protein AAF823_11030 [Planctomycetota bacterium]